MWFTGHAALGLLLLLPLAPRLRRLPSPSGEARDFLGITPSLAVLLLLFPNLPDLLHIADLRPWSHNLTATVVLPAAALIFLRKPFRLQSSEVVALMVSAQAHPLGDMTFGQYYPWFPWQAGDLQGLFNWNGSEDLWAEVLLTVPLAFFFFRPNGAGRGMATSPALASGTLGGLLLAGVALMLALELALLVLLDLVLSSDRWVEAALLLGTALALLAGLVPGALRGFGGLVLRGLARGSP